jgi:hypothetical protein
MRFRRQRNKSDAVNFLCPLHADGSRRQSTFSGADHRIDQRRGLIIVGLYMLWNGKDAPVLQLALDV